MPPPDTVMRADEEAVLREFLELWAMVHDRLDVLVRAAHIAGGGVRRIEEATFDLFDEFGGSPPQRERRGLSEDDAYEPSIRLAAQMPRLLTWLEARHSEHVIFARIVEYAEGDLARAAGAQPRAGEAPAIAFVDLTGYTELTANAGDERAAEFATALQAMAEKAASAHRGRVVKLLGDGVMLRYPSAPEAVRSVRELMADIVKAGPPSAHGGIAAGPVVVRDGDVYGHVVNLAARIASEASEGELLVSDEAADRLRAAAIESEDAGRRQLKGLGGPMRIARVRLC